MKHCENLAEPRVRKEVLRSSQLAPSEIVSIHYEDHGLRDLGLQYMCNHISVFAGKTTNATEVLKQ